MMMSTAVVVTDSPGRYAKQLLSHLGHKVTVEPLADQPAPAGRLVFAYGTGTVVPQGGALVLEVRLPPGHTFTAGAPQRVELFVDGRSTEVQLAPAGGDVLRATAAISPLKSPADAVYSVALFYCQDGHGSVCLVDRRRLLTRLAPTEGAPGRATVHYRPTPARVGS